MREGGREGRRERGKGREEGGREEEGKGREGGKGERGGESEGKEGYTTNQKHKTL